VETGFCRFLRRNQRGKRAHMWVISQLPSYSFTILLGKMIGFSFYCLPWHDWNEYLWKKIL